MNMVNSDFTKCDLWIWERVCDHPDLQDLPFKIELNGDGEIIMNAVRLDHSLFAEQIMLHLLRILGVHCPLEFAIATLDGIRSPDVVWISQERLQQVKGQPFSPIAPEICVEVMSPGNTMKKMMEKKELYLQAGAHEFWLCDVTGKMSFFQQNGEISFSEITPAFPRQIEI